MTVIYSLAHPDTGIVRYIGKTTQPEYRLKHHLNDRTHTHKNMWIKSLQGRAPIFEIISEVPDDEWSFWEQYWIAQFKAWGFDLVNGDNGGLGNHRLTDELKQKISKTLSGRPHPHFWKACASYDLDGRFVTEFPSVTTAAATVGACNGNISRSMNDGMQCMGYLWKRGTLGEFAGAISTTYINGKRPLSDSARAKLSISSRITNLGRKASPEAKKNMSLARLGKSPANKGRKFVDGHYVAIEDTK